MPNENECQKLDDFAPIGFLGPPWSTCSSRGGASSIDSSRSKTAAIPSRPWWSPARGLQPGTYVSTSIRSFDVDEHLREAVPYVIASWSTHGPATGLFTWCTMTGTQKDPESEAHLFRCEFSVDEPTTYHSLIGASIDYAILSLATEGELDRASRFREIFSPFGLTDELRVVLRIDGTVWGSATLLRTGGRFEPRQ
jgi:hypothetical protein